MIRRLPIVVLAFALTGCLTSPVPTQQSPSCSWTSTPARNPGQLCRSVFSVLATLAKAEREGNDAEVHRLAAPAVARRIIAHGRGLRRLGLVDLHIVPNIVLDTSTGGEIGAGFYLAGSTHHGRVDAQQGVFLQQTPGGLRLVHDQPDQDW